MTIKYLFPAHPEYLSDFNGIKFYLKSGNMKFWDTESFARGLRSAEAMLKSMVDEIDVFWEDADKVSPKGLSARVAPPTDDRVFLIHGRDDGVKEKVARFLEKLGLDVVILHEQPNKGRTIIEKFESHAEAGFAVALLTPDDVGSLADAWDKRRPRARQNVVLELGFFLGKLGRDHVCALTSGDVEIPSDYDGVIYIPLDRGSWRSDLAKELKAAGMEVDLTKVL